MGTGTSTLGGRHSNAHPELWELSPLRSSGMVRPCYCCGFLQPWGCWCSSSLPDLALRFGAAPFTRGGDSRAPGTWCWGGLCHHTPRSPHLPPSKAEAASGAHTTCRSVFPPREKATSSWLCSTAALMPLIIIDCNCAKIHPSQETGAIWTVILT